MNLFLKKETVAVLLLALALVIPFKAQAVKIKFAVLAPEGSSWTVIMNEIDEKIRARTKGKVKFKIDAGGKQGDESVVLQKMKYNIHAAGFTSVGTGKILPEIRVMEVPQLIQGYDEVDHVLSKMKGYFEKKLDDKGFILLGWAEAGPVHVFSATEAKTIADFKKTKMWAWKDDPLAAKFLEELGIKPVFIPLTDVLIQLETGMINSFYVPPFAAMALQWYPKAKYVSSANLVDSLGAVLITKKKWKKLKPEYQKVIREEMEAGCKKLVEQIRKDNAKAMDLLQKSGLKIVDYPQETLDAFQQASIRLKKKMVGELYSQELLDKVEGILKEYRASKK